MQNKPIYGVWRKDKPAEPGFSHELISPLSKNILGQTDLDTLDAVAYPGVDTLYKAFKRNVERIPNNDWLGTRVENEYKWVTWKEVADQAEHLSYGYQALEMIPDIQAEEISWKMMGIQAKNRLEWVICHLANMHQSATTVAFYDTLGPEASRYIINQTELTSMCVSVDYVSKISKMKIEDASSGEGKCKLLKNLVVFEDNISEEDRGLAKQAELNLYTLKEVIEIGRKHKDEGKATLNLPHPDHCFMFSYTSGTTGDPKGVKLTHKMILACGFAVNNRLSTNPITEDDSYCSYLPAAHSFEQALFGVAIQVGMKVGFFGGIILKLTEDIALLKPTLFPSVPRLFNRIYGKIQDKFKEATGLKGMLVNRAVNSKLRHLRNGDGVHHFLYDRLVFNKVKNMLGGKVRIMITGSAPIAADVLEFLKVCFCCQICEGYGMTETSAGTCITAPEDPETGHVGGPLQNVKVKLRDLPEMGYLSTNDPPTGEVCLWGPSITKGYFKNPEKTAEAFHGDWLLSGDVGMIHPNGAIKIIDRAKNIFKLSQGEYIAPEKLENVYVQSEWVMQTWIYGDSLRDHIVGVFVADPDRVKKFCKETGKEMNEELMKDEALMKLVFADFMKLAGENNLNSLEKCRAFHLTLEPFSQENDILTPTMKIKRNIAKKVYSDQIEELYKRAPMK